MKTKFFFIFLAGISLFNSCSKDHEIKTPICIREKIISSNGSHANQIWVFQYHKSKVFYVLSDCCDQYNELYDSECNYLCSPDGGFTGRGDGKCPDFGKEKKNGVRIW